MSHIYPVPLGEDRRQVILRARDKVRQFVQDSKNQGRLQDIALNQLKTAAFVGINLLADEIVSGQVTVDMLQRWLMEMISSASRAD